MKPKKIKSSPEFGKLILRINALETDAHNLNLHATAIKLSEAKNKAGWEFAEQIGKQISK